MRLNERYMVFSMKIELNASDESKIWSNSDAYLNSQHKVAFDTALKIFTLVKSRLSNRENVSFTFSIAHKFMLYEAEAIVYRDDVVNHSFNR